MVVNVIGNPPHFFSEFAEDFLHPGRRVEHHFTLASALES
jgi:hypothetical protein